jgi:hypothetical protein
MKFGGDMHDYLEKRIGLAIGESKQVEFGGKTWTMTRVDPAADDCDCGFEVADRKNEQLTADELDLIRWGSDAG